MTFAPADKLQEICAVKAQHLAVWKDVTPLADLERQAKEQTPPRGFEQALQAKKQSAHYGLITEIKKASPSAGLIRYDFYPAILAAAYEKGGAACLSVLTDAPYFQGDNDYLRVARGACSLPVLRKDFIIDPWQVVESRAIGADCILLIMAALDDGLAKDLHATARAYGMDVLIEVHNRDELDRALLLPDGMIGINNRNLKTLQVDLQTSIDLAPLVPNGRLIVGESGFKTRQNLDRALTEAGISSFLIGESLMRADDIESATAQLAAASFAPQAG